MTITWNTGSAAARFRSTRKKIEENRKKNKAASSQAMTLEYKIIYTIDGDIPVNPAWVGEKLEDAVDKLQIELHEKNLHGAHKLEFCYPEGWARP
jgi:hypothetical protein